ncbi:hypothetical protein J4573_48080 [Actinomadura barringtoniae]|uniref:Uncharacterized protein n=1 Tax=Actinomadura barringtoniae TaxID=1427535 RepID=A0A939PMR7_9ACTN|nr:hypothetical protein [Actinomadura barringtoniae]MBO2454918.1 hypothetical protein [Actinomadura barringtoniae]
MGDDKPGEGQGGGARKADQVFAVPPAMYDGHEQAVSGVAVKGNTAVAVGSETIDQPRGQFLVTTDGGKAWRAVNTDGVPAAVAAGPKGWVALGEAAWTSADGQEWTRRAGSFSPGDKVAGLAFSELGFVGVGTSSQGRAVAWTSPDGVAWQRVETAVDAEPVRVAAHGRNVVMQDRKGALWRSVDARTWTKADVPQSDGSHGPIVALASGPGGLYAAREGERKDSKKKRKIAVFFRSADGVGWARASMIDRRTYDRLGALGGSDSGLAALVPLTDGRVAVQRTTDGVNWQNVERLATDGGRAAQVAAALPKGVLVAGTQTGGAYLTAPGSRHGDVDLLGVPGAVTPDRTIKRLVAGGGTILAIGSAGGDAAVWSTRDGEKWTRSAGDGLGGAGAQRLTAATYGPHGWVTVGGSTIATSPDGASWHPAGGVHGTLSGAAYGTSGYVVVGDNAWRSDDLSRWTRSDLKASDVAAVSKGYVAVGGKDHAEAWLSADGGKWTAVTMPANLGPLSQVTARGDAVVAIGAGVVAFSGDAGRTWRGQAIPATLNAVVATPRGFALGGETSGDAAMWASADGATWRPIRPHGRALDGDGPQRLNALAVLGTDLVAVGQDDDVPTLWRTPQP